MLDLHGQGLVVDGLAPQGPEKVRQRRLHTGFGFIIPEDLQDHVRDRGDIEVGHLAGAFQVGQHHFLALGHGHLVVLDIRLGNSVTDAIQIVQLLGSRRGSEQTAQCPRRKDAHNPVVPRHGYHPRAKAGNYTSPTRIDHLHLLEYCPATPSMLIRSLLGIPVGC